MYYTFIIAKKVHKSYLTKRFINFNYWCIFITITTMERNEMLSVWQIMRDNSSIFPAKI